SDSAGSTSLARSIRDVSRRRMPRAGRPVAIRTSKATGSNDPWPFASGENPCTGEPMREGAGVVASGRIIDTGARYPLTSQDFFGHRGRRPAPMTKYVYFFGGGRAEGSSVMRNLLGGKGCELAEMTNLGIPVPPGFTVTTQAWAHYNRS